MNITHPRSKPLSLTPVYCVGWEGDCPHYPGIGFHGCEKSDPHAGEAHRCKCGAGMSDDRIQRKLRR